MTEEKRISTALRVWQEVGCSATDAATTGHLDDETQYRLAVPGGLQRAADADLEHLSLCPLCQNGWAAWLDTIDILADECAPGGERLIGFGFLKAAAASLFAEPVSFESSCGRFELSVYPERDNPDHGLVALEVKDHMDSGADSYCVVRDGGGNVILQGVVDDGRLAGRIDSLDRLDLKTWTVVVRRGDG